MNIHVVVLGVRDETIIARTSVKHNICEGSLEKLVVRQEFAGSGDDDVLSVFKQDEQLLVCRPPHRGDSRVLPILPRNLSYLH